MAQSKKNKVDTTNVIWDDPNIVWDNPQQITPPILSKSEEPQFFSSPIEWLKRFPQNFAVGVQSPQGIAHGISYGIEQGLPIAAGFASGGMSIPIRMLATGASMAGGNILGNDIREIAQTQPVTSVPEKLKEAAISGTSGAALEGIASGVVPFLAKKSYLSALSPSTELEPTARATMAQEGLNIANVGKRGFTKVNKLASDVGQQITSTVKSGSESGDMMAFNKVVGQAMSDLKRNAPYQAYPKDFVNEIKTFTKDIVGQHAKNLSTEEALLIKRDLGEQIRAFKSADKINQAVPANKYGNLAKTKTYFAVRDKLEEMYPTLKTLNEKDAKLIDLRDALAKAYNKEGNSFLKILGYPEMVAGGGVGYASHSIENAIATIVAVRLARSPYVQSALARAMNTTSQFARPFMAPAVSTVTGTQRPPIP